MSDNSEYLDASANPAAANAAAATLFKDDVPEIEIPTIPAPGDGFVRLPGGIVVDDKTIYEVEVSELTGSDEERIEKSKGSLDRSRFPATILACGTQKIGKYDADEHLDSLLVGDREYLLLAIRKATYGPEIEMGQYTCPTCGDNVDIVIEVDDIPVRKLDTSKDRQFEVRLRKGGKALVRLPVGADHTAYVEDPELTFAERNSILLGRCVLTLTTKDGEVYPVAGFPSLVKDDLGIVDRNKILNEIANRMPGPRYDEVEVEHAACGGKIHTPVGMVSLFPGL